VFKRIFGGILVFALLELFLLIWAGSRFGALPVFGIILLTGAAGVMVIRHFGVQSLTRLQAEVRGSAIARPSMGQGLLGALAGALLIMPGLLGDALGLFLLLPPVQRWIAGRYLRVPEGSFRSSAGSYGRVIVIEGEATEADKGPVRPNPTEPRLP
jgi:UPF0716 protein FxsA